MNDDLKLSIIIVSYNTKNILKTCLDSIFQKIKEVNFEIWVVDNGSTDESVEMIKKEFPKVNIIEKEKIVGGNCLAFKYDLLKNKLLGICGAGFSGFIGKKILYKFIYPLDETLSGIEDGEFSIKIEIAKMNKKINENDFKLLEEPLLLYTRHSESLSFGRQNNLVFIERYTKLLQKYAFLENENNLTPTLKDILSNCWIKLGMHYLIIGERKMAKEAIDHSLKIKKSLLGKFFKYINFLPPKFYLYCRIFFSEFFVENIYYKYNLIKFKKYYLKYKKDLDILIKSAKSI